jgi:cobyrinic acid a,c-diamide synthase
MARNCPRLVVAGLSGDSGKTITSLSLLTGLKQKGLSVSVFKKGPDYIDAAWLNRAAGSTCRNLDTYMVDRDKVLASFVRHSRESDLAVIEGNRGLFDGKDARGTHSTAELAKLLDAPVALVVNCTKTTRTVAAMIEGCRRVDPDLKIAGVILNRIAGPRHASVITDAIESICKLPVLGTIPKLGGDDTLIPGRHLGLVTPAEFADDSGLHSLLSKIATQHLDLDRLIEVARLASPVEAAESAMPDVKPVARVGYFRDSVFTFYYPENLEALSAEGAELVPVSSLDDNALPDLDALYIGGGFPETHAAQLSANRSLMDSVKQAVENSLPVYAECGGLIFLCRALQQGERSYPMAGVFPVDLTMHQRPVGHGYTELTVDSDNPFFASGTVIKGHEFHYSGPVEELTGRQGCMAVSTGVGLGNGRDGLVYRNCLATYSHLHADGVATWAVAIVQKAREYRDRRDHGEHDKSMSSDKDTEAVPGRYPAHARG